METVGDLLKGLVGIWVDMFFAILSVFPKFIKLVIWLLLALLILPCVFVAGTVFPAWEKWGEQF
ncbi:MAG: hypothetical protein KGI69_02725 [Patescibacteria group bacterium]|nr:hypothetical protein [Patescibacteria group bacterium]